MRRTATASSLGPGQARLLHRVMGCEHEEYVTTAPANAVDASDLDYSGAGSL